jgi:hypothetical protein
MRSKIASGIKWNLGEFPGGIIKYHERNAQWSKYAIVTIK